jgi:hypothetical protein
MSHVGPADRLIRYFWQLRGEDHCVRFFEETLNLPTAAILTALQNAEFENGDPWYSIELRNDSAIAMAAFFERDPVEQRPTDKSLPRNLRHIAIFLRSGSDFENLKERLRAGGFEFLGVLPSIYLQGPANLTFEITAAEPNPEILGKSPDKAKAKLSAWNSQERLWKNGG